MMTLRDKLIFAEIKDWPKIMRKDFDLLMQRGESATVAHMLVSRRAPRVNGEINVPDDGKGYEPLLARFPGDPAAMKSHGEGRSKFKKARERLSRAPRRDMSKPKHRLHPELVEQNRQRMISEDPKVAERDQREVREEIIEKHGSKKR